MLFPFFYYHILYLLKFIFLSHFQFNEDVVHPNLIDNLNFFIFLKKSILILKYILISFFKYPILIIIILSSIILYFKYNFFNKFSFLYTFILLFFLLIFSIYFQTKENIELLLPITLSRLIFPISGFYIFLIIQLLNRLKYKKNI